MHVIRVAEFGDPSVMVLASAPDLVPAPGQVVVNLAAAGVNPLIPTFVQAPTPTRPLCPTLPALMARVLLLP